MSERRTRTTSFDDPAETVKGAEGRTGMAFLQAILSGEVPRAPIQATLGFELLSVGDGEARFGCTPGEHLYNPMGGVHGGGACTLLDSAMGSAVMTTLDEKSGYTTAALTVQLTRPITAATGPIVAEGRVVHRGARVVTAEGRLIDGRGRVLAHGSTTCVVVERR